MKSSFFAHSLPPADGEIVGMEFDSDDKDGNCNLDYGSHYELVDESRDTKFLHLAVIVMICQIETQMCTL